MNSVMAKKLKVILDTNVIISAIIFFGKPRQILNLTLEKQVTGITSKILLAELSEILSKKFPDYFEISSLFETSIKEVFEIVSPTEKISICRDADDNRVLEVSVEGDCDFIISGDKDLLILKSYKKIKILSASEFLELLINKN